MSTELAALINKQRRALGLSNGDVVKRMGYGNLGRGASRLGRWLNGAEPNSQQVVSLALALEVSEDEIRLSIERQRVKDIRMKREKRALDPNSYLTIRLIPGFAGTQVIKPGLSLEEMIEQSAAHAKKVRRLCWLNTPDSVVVSFDVNGQYIISKDGPRYQMSIGGRRVVHRLESISAAEQGETP